MLNDLQTSQFIDDIIIYKRNILLDIKNVEEYILETVNSNLSKFSLILYPEKTKILISKNRNLCSGVVLTKVQHQI